MAGIIVFFVINETELSSYLAQISKHINPPNNKIHSYDQKVNIIVNLSNKKCKTTTNPHAISIRFRNIY